MSVITTRCAYCNAEIETTKEAETANAAPPALTDDAAWEALAREHNSGCEWIATRAHRIDSAAVAENKYLELFANPLEACEFENQALSVGREFLPPCALAVLDDGQVTAEYWRWLGSQVDDER